MSTSNDEGNTNRSNPARQIVRFSLDLDIEQKRFLQLFGANHGIQAAVVLRVLIYLLETDKDLMHDVLDTIFIDDDEN